MSSQSDVKRLSKLRAEIRLVEQAPFVPDIDRVGRTFQAYVTNASTLRHHIEVPHPDFSVAVETRVPGNNPEIYRRYYAEPIRLLLNYTASASALVEHMRIIEQKMQVTNPLEFKELIRRRRKFSDTGVAHFIKNLRNFVLHRDLPSVTGRISFRQGDPDFRFDTLLDADLLLSWEGWDTQSKQFMSQHNPISLSLTIQEYHSLAQAFYDWVFEDIQMVCFNNAKRMADLMIAVDILEHRIAKR